MITCGILIGLLDLLIAGHHPAAWGNPERLHGGWTFLIVGLPRKDVILILGEPETVVDGPEATVPGVEEHQPHVTVPATCADLNVIHFPERADLPPRSKQEQFLGQFGVNLKPVHRFGHVLSLHRSGSYADMLDSHTRPCCLQVPYTSSGISGSPLSSTKDKSMSLVKMASTVDRYHPSRGQRNGHLGGLFA